MSMASLFPSRTVRFAALSIVVVGVTLLVLSFVAPTLSCPGPPPQPLRQLYVQSDRIVIARVGKTEITKVENPDADNSDAEISYLKTALLVSSTLKGEPQPVVYVSHTMYRDYKDQLSLMTGDENLLLFLDKVEGMDGYDVDMNYGLKKLSDADMAVYVTRIEELASIMKSGKPNDTEIVEWLVRCAEEPATRWEGTYELQMSLYAFEQPLDESAPSDEVEITEDQTAQSTDETEVSSEIVNLPGSFEFGWPSQPNFAKLLTTEQKYRLTTALINSNVMTNSDNSLLEIVQRWDDPRLVPYLLAQIDLISRRGNDDQAGFYFTENLMTVVADKLGDDALKAAVKKFDGSSYERDDSYEDEDDPSEQQAEEADEAAVAQRRNAELQHFVTLALSSTPGTPTAEIAGAEVTAEP